MLAVYFVSLLQKGEGCLTLNGIEYDQGRRKMKKVRGALRALKAQVLPGGPGTHPPEFFSIFSTLKHFFLHIRVLSFAIIIGLRHV